ncbi:MAG: hypothetical protein M1530_01070 [Candidatus Marsarchaeota archaeon]|nr:hypothetical protein [Candidatus Marsarchaeota archaeon]
MQKSRPRGKISLRRKRSSSQPRARAAKKRASARPARKFSLSAPNGRELGNPMAVAWPSGLDSVSAGRIVSLGRLQHRLWTWAVALSLLALVLVSVFDFGPMFFGWPPTGAARERLLAQTELTALLVLAVELAAQFRAAKNKLLFLRTHWLLILAVLPLGVLLRAFRVLEIFSGVRAVQMWGKMGELHELAPALNVPILNAFVSWGDGITRSVSKWSGLGEFIELLSRLGSKLRP